MVDAYGLGTSIISVGKVSIEVISACYKYYSTTKGANSDILTIFNIVSGLKNVLDDLHEFLAKSHGSQTLHLPEGSSLDEALKGCETALKELSSKLQKGESKDLNGFEPTVPVSKN